ncbi:hypothetical protein ACFLQN_01985 [Candidatus Aenigmatarchaeota archaeon]
MKHLIIIIVIIIIVAIFSIWSYLQWQQENECSIYHPENCDYSCSTDDDCKSVACDCVNKDETYDTKNIAISCIAYTCQCIDNTCESVTLTRG